MRIAIKRAAARSDVPVLEARRDGWAAARLVGAKRRALVLSGAALLLSSCTSPDPRSSSADGVRLLSELWVPTYLMPLDAKPAQATPPLSPFSDSSVSITVRGHFARGEAVVVQVCLGPDHSIASAQVVESSGDRQFDELAVGWARRVQLRSMSEPGRVVAHCGPVRVELHDKSAPVLGHGLGEQLG